MIKPISIIKKSALLGLIFTSALSINAQNNKKGIVNKADEVSFEHNINLNERIKNEDLTQAQIDEMYKNLGTYGASIELQRIKDGYITNIVHPMLNNLPDSKFWDMYDKCFNQFPQAVKEYIEQSKAKTAEKLYKDGVPSARECSNYLERQFIDDDAVSTNDYSRYKKDIRRFKKAQGNTITTQSVAELIAYKQFKLDSLAYRKLLQAFGFLSNSEIKKNFENGDFSKTAAPRPVHFNTWFEKKKQ